MWIWFLLGKLVGALLLHSLRSVFLSSWFRLVLLTTLCLRMLNLILLVRFLKQRHVYTFSISFMVSSGLSRLNTNLVGSQLIYFSTHGLRFFSKMIRNGSLDSGSRLEGSGLRERVKVCSLTSFNLGKLRRGQSRCSQCLSGATDKQ